MDEWLNQGVLSATTVTQGVSTYMGHAKVSNTYWYLTGTPELLQVVGRRFEHFVDPYEAEEDDDG